MARPRRTTDGGRPLSNQLDRQIIVEYQAAWKVIKQDLDRVNAQVKAARKAGTTINRGWLTKQARLHDLERGIEQQIARAVRASGTHITSAQARAIAEGRVEAARLIRATLRVPAEVSFATRPPFEAFEKLIGNTATGKPLGDLLAKLPAEGAVKMRRRLALGLLNGRHPTAVARDIRDLLGGNMARARTIARTELMRAYREASRATYAANRDVVTGWEWLAEPNACPFCAGMNGTIHSVDEELDSHPNCRCAMLPQTKSWSDLGFNIAA